jgi:hypothetical protein
VPSSRSGTQSVWLTGREHGHKRQPRILQQHAGPELDVEPAFVQESEAASVAVPVLHLFDLAPERAARGQPRLVCAHAVGEVSILEQLEMCGELSGQLGLGTGRANKRPQAKHTTSHELLHLDV